MSKFNKDNCIIPQIWCGLSEKIPAKKQMEYYKIGDRYECLKKGFGAGKHNERKQHIDKNSIKNIKYIQNLHTEISEIASSNLRSAQPITHKKLHNFNILSFCLWTIILYRIMLYFI